MDRGHELTDEKIKKMEDELRKEYTQAAAEIENKLKDYMDRFTKKDAIWQKWVKEGKKTQEEYAKWRTGQMAVGKRWEKMKDSIADDLLHVNDIATGIVTGQMPEIFATNANYAIYSAESDAGIDTGLTLYNRDAVNTIIQDEPDLLLPPGQKVSAEIAAGTAKRWEREKIQSVMLQGILQGESIPNIARRLAEKVADSNFKAAVRNARTMSTNAQNLGRYHAYERLKKRGVGVTLEWAATLDNRTRHEHRMMHGQRRNVGEPFDVEGIKIMYPAQTGKFMGVSDIPQRMIWNCRCTILAWVKGYEHDTITKSDKMGDMTFEEWLKAKEQPEPILKQKEKGDAISGAFNKQYAGKHVGPARPLGSGYTYTPPEPNQDPEPIQFADGEAANKYFGQRPDRKLRSEDREEYDRQREEYEQSTYKQWSDGLSPEQVISIGAYSGDCYSGINGYLRREMTKNMVEKWDQTESIPLREMIGHIEGAIDTFELKDPIRVFRTCEADVLEKLKEGAVFHDEGFGSTTVLTEKKASGNVVMIIDVPAGRGYGAWINPLSGAEDDEYEFLLQRGSNFIVKSIKTVDGDTVVEMQLLGSTPDELGFATKEEVIERWKKLGLYDEQKAEWI